MLHNHSSAFSRLASGLPSQQHVRDSETTAINLTQSPEMQLDGHLARLEELQASHRPTTPTVLSFATSCCLA